MDTNGHTPLYEDYVSFEIAKLLKEKGFDCECNAYYRIPIQSFSRDSFSKCLNVIPKNWNKCCEHCVVYEYISMPTQSLVLKWLREVHKIIITIDYNEDSDCEDNERYGFSVYYLSRKVDLATYVTYEEACEAAIKYSLKNLI